MPVRVGVVKVLRDRRISAGFGLALEREQILLRAARLGMVFGIGGDLDVKRAAEFLADERDQLVGVTKLARRRRQNGNAGA